MALNAGEIGLAAEAALKTMHKYDAGVAKVVMRREDGSATGALILLEGPDIDDVLAAIEAVEQSWN